MKIKSILFSLLMGFGALAQQTGSFNTQVNFMSQMRTLSCYVPTNYDSTLNYKLMIGLHGMGDNSTNYRNALINNLNIQNAFPNTIFVFPDGGADPNSDFYTPAGDEGIIVEAMNFAMTNYSIDSSYVVLQGFSLGGRSAAKYGLENPTQFKGLLLNTPAFQGSADLRNHPTASLLFNYGNASQVPIFVSVGTQDAIYHNILENIAIDTLKKNNAVINYHPVSGMGHTVPGVSVMSEVYPFFETPASTKLDLDLFDTDMPQHICSSSVPASCFIQNRSNSNVTSIDLEYDFAGSTGTYTWTGNLGAFEHTEVVLPTLSAAAGQQVLEVSIGDVNGSLTDSINSNNSIADTTEADLQAEDLDVAEGFEAQAPGWVFNERGTLFQWYKDTDVKKTGTASIGNFNTILLFYTRGNIESFESPVTDLSSGASPQLTFDVAYNYHEYTAAVLGVDTVFADTLEVVISTDCGQSWQSLYKKGGDELATAANPILNPLNLNQVFFNPTASEWRKDSIDLSAFSSETEVIIRFNYISANGGSINLDNILIDGANVSLKELTEQELQVYPNPASNHVNILSDAGQIEHIRILDITGNPVLEKDVEKSQTGTINLDVGHLDRGTYLLEVTSENGKGLRKLSLH